MLFSLLALLFFGLGAVIFVRAFRADRYDRARYLKAAVGSMAVGAGNALLMKSPELGFLFFLMGAILVFGSRKVQPKF